MTLTVPTLNVQTLTSWLINQKPLVMLDVRPLAQRVAWSIHGSIHIDAADALWASKPEILDTVALPQGLPIVTICAAGRTSLLAAAYLQDQGYLALSLEGGMQAWSLAWDAVEVPVHHTSAQILQVRRLGKGCLSYVVGHSGQAAVIDPSLPHDVYRTLAEEQGWRITDVLETHIHADHLSRAKALAEANQARLWLPEQERVTFACHKLAEGAVLRVGGATLQVLATPGHTRESSAYLLDNQVLFSGDTIAPSGLGRPDLTDATAAEEHATLLHQSLQRLWELPDTIVVLPAHTNDSLHLNPHPVQADLGHLKEQFPDVRLSGAAFIERILSRIPATPANYKAIINYNETGLEHAEDHRALEIGANRCSVA